LMTGRHVACGPETAERLLKWLSAAEPGLGLSVTAWGDLAEIIGPPGWETRRYVPLVTRFHAEGGSRCLIGTRALLGEGWDAPPPDEQFDALNATMLRRAGERGGARERWAIGTPFADEPVATVTVATRHALGLPAKAAGSLIRRRRRGGWAAVALAVALAATV